MDSKKEVEKDSVDSEEENKVVNTGSRGRGKDKDKDKDKGKGKGKGMSMVDSDDEEKLVMGRGRGKSKSTVDSDGKEELVKGKSKRNVVPLNDDSGTNMELPDLVVESTDPGGGGKGDLQLLKMALLFSLFMTNCGNWLRGRRRSLGRSVRVLPSSSTKRQHRGYNLFLWGRSQTC